jgi:hypothetical protein
VGRVGVGRVCDVEDISHDGKFSEIFVQHPYMIQYRPA